MVTFNVAERYLDFDTVLAVLATQKGTSIVNATVPYQRLSDRIYVLCEIVAHTTDERELTALAEELRAALHEQSNRLRSRLAAPFIERRKQNSDPPQARTKLSIIKAALDSQDEIGVQQKITLQPGD